MNRFWQFAEWRPYEFDGETFIKHCSFLNNEEVVNAGIMTTHDFRREPFPIVQLAITLPEFDADCFRWNAFTFISERMRDAMALGPAEIQYFDVDASASAPLPRSKNYKVMNIPITEDISDPALSNYQMRRLTPDTPEVPILVHEIAIQPDARPTHHLFWDKFFRGYVFCTDALAMRVLRAGCTGVRFFDPSRMSLIRPKRFRTLRGVEETGDWDSVNKVLHTTLVEAIH